MNEHDAIRELLPLAAAGALDSGEQRRMEKHAATCSACAAELEGWAELTGALRRLPTPQAPADMVERARARVAGQLAAQAESRWNQRFLVFLVLFAWTMTLATWPIVKLLSEGVASWLDVRFANLWIGLAGYTALAWLTAGVAAVALGLWHRRARRTA